MTADRTIALNTLIIWALWVGGFALLCFDIFFRSTDDVGHLGLAMIAGAVMRHVCCLIGKLDARERNAFDIGREVGREDRLRSLR